MLSRSPLRVAVERRNRLARQAARSRNERLCFGPCMHCIKRCILRVIDGVLREVNGLKRVSLSLVRVPRGLVRVEFGFLRLDGCPHLRDMSLPCAADFSPVRGFFFCALRQRLLGNDRQLRTPYLARWRRQPRAGPWSFDWRPLSCRSRFSLCRRSSRTVCSNRRPPSGAPSITSGGLSAHPLIVAAL